jgi:hypothetical protein
MTREAQRQLITLSRRMHPNWKLREGSRQVLIWSPWITGLRPLGCS